MNINYHRSWAPPYAGRRADKKSDNKPEGKVDNTPSLHKPKHPAETQRPNKQKANQATLLPAPKTQKETPQKQNKNSTD